MRIMASFSGTGSQGLEKIHLTDPEVIQNNRNSQMESIGKRGNTMRNKKGAVPPVRWESPFLLVIGFPTGRSGSAVER